MLSRVDPEAPLVVAANRDERMERPARAMTVLAEGPPRILGGYDELGGGTWLAINEHGLVAGLTNRPLEGGRDPAKRSRGELPLWLAGWPSAREAVERFVEEFEPADYNPCWMLVGDRQSLFSIDMTADGMPVAEALPPGSYVLENSPLGTSSPKSDRVNEQVATVATKRGDALVRALGVILGDHTVPPEADGADEADGQAGKAGTADRGEDGGAGVPPGDDPGAAAVDPDAAATAGGPGAAMAVREPAGSPPDAALVATSPVPGRADGPAASVPPVRPRALLANCVHSDGYGTRSALICRVPLSPAAPIRVLVADGAPCTTPMFDATGLWSS